MIRKLLFAVFVLTVLISNGLSGQFTMDNVIFWTGSGSNRSVLVIDFNDQTSQECLAWGYRFDGAKTAQDMLTEIAGNDPDLTIVLNAGWIFDIIYQSHSGYAGNPEYWLTFSHEGSYNWEMNTGLSTPLYNGSWFGCSYSGVDSLFNPLFLPGYPAPAPNTQIHEWTRDILVINNPVKDYIQISGLTGFENNIALCDLSGRVIAICSSVEITNGWPVSGLEAGMYTLRIETIGSKIPSHLKFIKQ
jgi:hypothetical protein